MASFLSRMANEASAALSDAYGHLMHGDDAGASAKVVWVVHPTDVPIDIHSSGIIADTTGTSASVAAAAAAMSIAAAAAGGEHSMGGGASSSAAHNKIHQHPPSTKSRDEVGGGTSVTSPGRNSSPYLFTQKFDLGMTFIEINDRAYVRSVDAGSKAEKAGIQPRDCVQFALVVGGPQFEDLQSIRQQQQQRRSSVAPSTSPHHHHHHGRGRNSNRDYYDRENNAEEILDAKATKFALECEKRGMRTSYNELRDLFAGCTLRPKGEGGGVSSEGGTAGAAGGATKNETMESMLHLPTTRSPSSSRPNSTTPDDDFTIGSNSLIITDSVGGVFEKTKKSKEYVSSRRVPLPDNKTAKNVTLNVTNAAMHVAGRCFDGDDGEGSEYEEDHHRGGTMMHGSTKSSSLPPLDTPATPIKSNNLISSSSPRQSGGTYGDGMLEQSLWPVVLVFRRTVQRKRMLGNNKEWGSPGLSLRGSLFGIPSLRMDDECDRAAALIRQLAPRTKGNQTGHHADADVFCTHDIDGDSINAPTVATATENAGLDDNIEASTIRGMIEAAVGLGFVRVSKVVVGVSLQHGSGIIISRLPDGTWSAPSALGVYGLGVGFQFGLEVADFMFIIQTNEGMEHFKSNGNFVVGGNIGAAVINCGREAYGAASLGVCSGMLPLDEQNEREDAKNEHVDDDERTYQSNKSNSHGNRRKKKGNDIAPMVAYAKSQGLYFGVSVDGLRFFTRNDINARTYKFSMLNDTSAKYILSGLVVPPPEAEDLYSALHSVEYIHEIIELPRPPEMLRKDSMNDWRYDRSIVCIKGEIIDSSNRKSGNYPRFSFLSTLNREESDRFAQFETKFKKFMYGGVTVQHLKPNSAPTRDGMTRREKRTLWLMLPEVGSLRLGLVSKVKDNGIDATMDDVTVASSAASSRADADDLTAPPGTSNIRLSTKYSVSLTDITSLSQDPNATIRLSPDDATEHLRVISICDATGKTMLFLANSNREAELLFCGLKLLLECETSRLSVRGGVPLNKLGGTLGKGALSPVSARGTASYNWNRREGGDINKRHAPRNSDLHDKSKYSSLGEPGSSSDESRSNDGRDSNNVNQESEIASLNDRHKVPEGRQSWSQLPGRNKMKEIATGGLVSRDQPQYPTFELGKPICSDIATNISLPLPLSVCRVLILDSLSPVNRTWETGRADTDFRHDAWMFPPGSIREFEVDSCSEQQLISRGSMTGAQRTITYNRVRNSEMVRLSETVVVEQDDVAKGLVFVIKDEMPRRGFQVKACLHLRSFGQQSCEARVVTDIRPVGKNISNQQAVYKAYVLVLDEMKKRYGLEEKGLLAVFLDVCNTLPRYGGSNLSANNLASPNDPHASSRSPTSKITSSITSFKDVLPVNKVENTIGSRQPQGNRSPSNRASVATTIPPSPTSARRFQQSNKQERPSTPSIRTVGGSSPQPPAQPEFNADEFANFPDFDDIPKNPVTVEVKPLPKIRLDLLPVPREEDEEEDNSMSAADKLKRKSKHSKHKHRRSSRNK